MNVTTFCFIAGAVAAGIVAGLWLRGKARENRLAELRERRQALQRTEEEQTRLKWETRPLIGFGSVTPSA